jgi:bifunctional non-homologous end joining protein LigD
MSGMTDRLDSYRRKRDARRTPEPVPEGPPAAGRDDRFVIQQHHARSLHWDVRLERDGVLVSFAVPRGLPRDQTRNHLAKHTEDHPLEYLDFAGDIPAGEYGGGRMTIHDHGTYTTDKWRDDEIGVTFHGSRASGRYIFFRTGDRDWMVRRMDPPAPGWHPPPDDVAPMLATRSATLPADDAAWAYEPAWGGERTVTAVTGGRVPVARGYPELRELGEALAPVEAVLDGTIVVLDGGRPDPAALARRTRHEPGSAAAKRAAAAHPVQYLIHDLLWLEGTPTVTLGYAQRRELLDGLDLAGPHWQTVPSFTGGGDAVLAVARAQGLPGITAKRLDSPYRPGARTRLWLDLPA